MTLFTLTFAVLYCNWAKSRGYERKLLFVTCIQTSHFSTWSSNNEPGGKIAFDTASCKPVSCREDDSQTDMRTDRNGESQGLPSLLINNQHIG